MVCPRCRTDHLEGLDAEEIDKPSKPGPKGTAISEKNKKVLMGSWLIESERFSFTLTFSAKGNTVTGKISSAMGETELKDIAFDGKTLTFNATFKMGERSFSFSAQVQIEGEKMKGTLSSPMGKMEFTGEKEKKK